MNIRIVDLGHDTDDVTDILPFPEVKMFEMFMVRPKAPSANQFIGSTKHP